MNKSIILTGLRSNEEPTIGNYLGCILPMVSMQREYAGKYQINMFVPDLHSFTTPIDHSALYHNTLQNLKYYIASGIDMDNPDTYIYRQSYISAHSELAWILSCFTYFGEMSRMTQFKEKSEELNAQKVTVGLFNYPILMAADILLYGTKYIPTGEDQFQHLEIMRDIAIRFNKKFGDVFVVPEITKLQSQFIKRDSGLRIRNLTDPLKKMSKSCPDDMSKILLVDNPDKAYDKIMRATTDSLANIKFDWDSQPGISNLLQISACLSGLSQDEVNGQWQGKTNYSDLKKFVGNQVKDFLIDFQAKLADITDEGLLAKLVENEAGLTPIANATLLKAQQAVGLRPRQDDQNN